jgi:hypothetical protein
MSVESTARLVPETAWTVAGATAATSAMTLHGGQP